MNYGMIGNLLSGEHIQDCGRPQREVGPHISTYHPANATLFDLDIFNNDI